MGQRKTEIEVSEAHIIAGFIRRGQARFNRDHSTPNFYGENEWIVVGAQYSEPAAHTIMLDFLNKEWPTWRDDISIQKHDMWPSLTNFGVGEWEGEITYIIGSGEYAENCWQGWSIDLR